jgi:hypothetical protein
LVLFSHKKSDLVERDDDGWYPQLRMHYYLTLGREFLTNRDAKRAAAQLEAGENSIWKPDFNKGQLLPAILLLENLIGGGCKSVVCDWLVVV